MTRFVLLDTGPLGQVARRRPDATTMLWARRLTGTGARLVVPEIGDYELRRELLRAGLTGSVQALDELATAFDYLPIDTSTLRLAARLWAQVRQQGYPTTGLKELDGDVILAAQAQLLVDAGHDVVVSTANVRHLDRLVPERRWDEITS